MITKYVEVNVIEGREVSYTKVLIVVANGDAGHRSYGSLILLRANYHARLIQVQQHIWLIRV